MTSATASLPEPIEQPGTPYLAQPDDRRISYGTPNATEPRGTDISHLSRSTIANIQNDVVQSRTYLQSALEVKRQLEMTRKDLKNLLRLARDIFSEMEKMNVVVNGDPSNAARVLAAAKSDETVAAASAAGHPNDPVNKDRGAGWLVPSGASADFLVTLVAQEAMRLANHAWPPAPCRLRHALP